jgi:hypothetical protein
VNTGALHPAVAAEIIKVHRDHVVTAEIETQNTARLKEVILGQQVVHHIIYEKGIPIHFLEAAVAGKIVTLHGVTNSQSLVEAAAGAAREVVPAGSVRTEIQVVQEYSVIP